MAARYSWRSHLRFSLVSVPVQAFNVVGSAERGQVNLHQLHDKCHSRIRYKKTCPVHGEVPNDEIVSAYESGENQYVVIEEDELDKLRPESDKSVRIETFIKSNQIDPMYFTGQHYYLVPDGAAAAQPYAVLAQAMEEQQRAALGQATLFNRERLFLLRSVNATLVLSTLHYADELRKPEQLTDSTERAKAKREELKLAQALIDASSKAVKLDQFEDVYRDRLHELIEAKVEGRDVVAPPEEDAPPVINLMDALRASMKKQGRGQPRRAVKSAAKATPRKPATRRKRRVS